MRKLGAYSETRVSSPAFGSPFGSPFGAPFWVALWVARWVALWVALWVARSLRPAWACLRMQLAVRASGGAPCGDLAALGQVRACHTLRP